jgi:hypothetical protein
MREAATCLNRIYCLPLAAFESVCVCVDQRHTVLRVCVRMCVCVRTCTRADVCPTSAVLLW